MSLNINQSSRTNRVREKMIFTFYYTQSGFSTLDLAPCRWRASCQHLFLSTSCTKTTRQSTGWLESWPKLQLRKCSDDVERFRNAAWSEGWSEQVGIQHACTAWGGGEVCRGYTRDSKRCWGYSKLNWKSSRAAWWDIQESGAAVSPHSRF